jgi:serpin B
VQNLARSSAVGRRRVTRIALVAVLLCACTGTPSPDGPSPEPTRFVPDQIASIEGANVLVRGAREAAPDVSTDALASVAQADAEFALDLFRELSAESNENLVVGPHSIWTALAMVWAGTRGQTASEMADVLHFDQAHDRLTPLLNALDLAILSRNQPGAVDLRLANQVFAEPRLPLLDGYLETLTRDFGAPLAELAFSDPEAARQVINDWAADRTNDRIKELFPPGTITPLTVLVLCNAVSMDAAWTYLFDPALTTVAPFRLADGTTINVPTMHFNLYLPLATGVDFQAVELPYGKGDLSMVVVVPDDLDAFAGNVDPDGLRQIFDAISEQGIHLHLPKFSFSSDVALDETLQRMGIRSAYGASADFSGMTGRPGLFLDTVQHEAFIEVDEAGTEAHAATGAAMAVSHGPTIMVDRPFFFVIRDRPTGAILFLGRVTDPSADRTAGRHQVRFGA